MSDMVILILIPIINPLFFSTNERISICLYSTVLSPRASKNASDGDDDNGLAFNSRRFRFLDVVAGAVYCNVNTLETAV